VKLAVLLAEDSEELRGLVRWRCEQHPELAVVGEASDGREALRLAGDLRPDVVLVDLLMPGELGPDELLSGLKRSAPDSAVMVFSGADPRSLVGEEALAGIDEYLPKTADLRDLAERVYALGAGRQS
jgi:two-component system, NarL family, nitrate/nitrite response regulator NarL